MPKSTSFSKSNFLFFIILGLAGLAYGIYSLMTVDNSQRKSVEIIASWAVILGCVVYIGSIVYYIYIISRKQTP